MIDRFDEDMAELLDVCADPRSNVQVVEATPLYLLLDLDCRGAVKRPNGAIEFLDHHLVRFVRAEGVHGLLSVYEPRGDYRLVHPNVREEPPFIICSNLEEQLERGPIVPLWSIVALVYDIIGGASWAMNRGIFSVEAAQFFAAAQARGELPFETRTLI